MNLAIVDYGMGNHASLVNALKKCGSEPVFVSTAAEIKQVERLILPGVGAFGAAMKRLAQMNLVDSIKNFSDTGKPMLGVCLGMQIMFESGEEGGQTNGLGFFKGAVQKMNLPLLKVPHVGFNDLEIKKNIGLFKGMIDHPDYYFTHSYWVSETEKDVVAATCNYGRTFVAAVEKGNVCATQFHPELSQKNGLTLLSNFLNIKHG